MSCCAPGTDSLPARLPTGEEIELASRDIGDGLLESWLTVPGAHCGACIASVEKAALSVDGISSARLNLSTHTLAFKWKRGEANPARVAASVAAIGYENHVAEPVEGASDPVLKSLLIALGIAGFAAGNIMLLSVSVWSGADGATRDMFHWISALIALPAIAWSGGPFFRPAWSAVRKGQLNMDVPISLAVILAALMSLYETINHGGHAYFDAAVSLLFFLLVGRTLDHLMRERARSAVRSLARLSPAGATIISEDGSHEFVPVGEVTPGMKVLVAAGNRVPVDGLILQGTGSFDCSIVSGESKPVTREAGASINAGVMNLDGPVVIEATATARDSFVAEMIRMMGEAENAKAGYRRLADRAASFYAPAVHLLALGTFLGWLALGQGFHFAASTAIAVLVITCPCALGLAVPIVHVVAAGRLFRSGIMVRNGAALEKLAEVDHAIFDKTGTLTRGIPVARLVSSHDRDALNLAANLASASHHPFSRAIASQFPISAPMADLSGIREHPGHGLEADWRHQTLRLGRPDWALGREAGEGIVLSVDGRELARFEYSEVLRPGGVEIVRSLANMGIGSEMLTGDSSARAGEVARATGIDDWKARVTPSDKLERMRALVREGHRPLMVGDGINDAPALAMAHASFAPAEAADIGRASADFVFLHGNLEPVADAITISRKARKLVLQNFAIAIAYNLVAVPMAVMGHATPLVAALAMSSSSILVVLNALRLNIGEQRAASHTLAQDASRAGSPGKLQQVTP
ncbi:MAG: heavy metal translocating P-type ATPase [Rhizobiaceae bacterium]